MTQKTYNGWTNYETWVVKLWMDNEEGSQGYWTEQAEATFERAEADHNFTKSERAKLDLAEALKDQHEEGYLEILKPANAECSVWSDLLGAAMSEVNWHEIANSLLEDNCEEYSKEEQATA